MYFNNKLLDNSLTIGVIGLGYVGIPLAQRISEAGYRVIGFDVLLERIDQLNAGQSPIKHISDDEIHQMRNAGFKATADFAESKICDVLIICVPTPLDKSREPDLSYVVSTMDMLQPYMRSGQLISLESTTWPGTTKQILLPYVEEAGFKIGKDYFLVYSPEREDPGNERFTTRTIPKVLGGVTNNCLEAGSEIYAKFIDTVVPVSSTDAAEMVKLLENIHRSINIGLVNEMKIVADAMGLDLFEIIDAAATKPFGFTAYYPGPGIGGHCIPIDPFYLTWKAREFGLHTRFIELAGEINAQMPQYVVDKTVRALNEDGKSLNGSKILVLGIAYKRDVDDMRESPSLFIMQILRDWGAHVNYSDPNVPVFPHMRDHHFELDSVEINSDTIAYYDAVLLLTDHTEFDYDVIKKHAKILVDTRGKFRGQSDIVRA
jgi:UDP-N-acetyl-D-glucosamine dehydrogenase